MSVIPTFHLDSLDQRPVQLIRPLTGLLVNVILEGVR